MTTATQAQNNWWKEVVEQALIYVLVLYIAIGFFCIYGLFQPATPGERLFECLFAVPVGLYYGYMLVVRPLLIAIGFSLFIVLRLIPLVITGFGVGIGFWLAMHLL